MTGCASEGWDKMDAILQTCRERARPVVLTALSAILGVLPIAFGLGLELFHHETTINAPSTQWWISLSQRHRLRPRLRDRADAGRHAGGADGVHAREAPCRRSAAACCRGCSGAARPKRRRRPTRRTLRARTRKRPSSRLPPKAGRIGRDDRQRWNARRPGTFAAFAHCGYSSHAAEGLRCRSAHILIIILILILLGAIPAWPYSRGWGYGPSGILGVVLVVVLILVLMGRI